MERERGVAVRVGRDVHGAKGLLAGPVVRSQAIGVKLDLEAGIGNAVERPRHGGRGRCDGRGQDWIILNAVGVARVIRCHAVVTQVDLRELAGVLR